MLVNKYSYFFHVSNLRQQHENHKIHPQDQRGGYEGLGKPEQRKGDLSGFWSRRIDACNRLVYRIEEKTIEILSCKTHHE